MKLSNNLTIDNVYDAIVSRHPGIWGYDYEQKAFIRRVLEEGLDAKYIANPRLSQEQMICIYQGLKKGLDVSIYAKKIHSAYLMKLARSLLAAGANLESCVVGDKIHLNKLLAVHQYYLRMKKVKGLNFHELRLLRTYPYKREN